MLRSRGAEGRRPTLALAVLLVLLLSTVPGSIGSAVRPPSIDGARGPGPAAAGPWTNLTPASGAVPPGTAGGTLAPDYSGGNDLWFGGSAEIGAQDFGLTWTFTNGTWTNATGHLAGAPPARTFATMAYDPDLQGVLLFGGLGDPTYLNDTWFYRDGGWTNLTGSVLLAPPARAEASMAFDNATDQMVLFGGLDAAGPLADTWAFAAGHWTRLTPTISPPAACCGAMAFDVNSSTTVLVESNGGGALAQTWSYAAGNWTNESGTPAPSTRGWPTLVADPAVGGVLLFGGSSVVRPPYWPLADVWIYADGRWTYAAGGSGQATDPSPRWAAAAAPLVGPMLSDCFLLVGGAGTNGTPTTASGIWEGCGNRTVWSTGHGGPGGGGEAPVVGLTASAYEGLVPFSVNVSVSVADGTAPFSVSICTSTNGCNTTGGWNGSAPVRSELTVTSAGPVLVSALVTDADDLSGSATITVTGANAAALTASPGVGPTTGFAPLTTSFRTSVGGGQGPYQVQWTFGDGTAASGSPNSTESHTYVDPGTYHPTLVITDTDHRSIAVALPAITVNAPAAPSNGTGTGSLVLEYLLPGSIVVLGLSAAIGVYVIRRRRVERDADDTFREVTDDDGPPPPEDGSAP